MTDDHWFDALNKSLMRDTPRRTLLHAAALIAGLALGAAPIAEATKPRKKGKVKRKGNRARKGNGNRKGKGKRTGSRKEPRQRPATPTADPAQSCSGGACAGEPQWAGNAEQISWCEFVCQQCDGDDPRQFCIVGTETKDAICCSEGTECCGNQCCGEPHFPGQRCCNGVCTDVGYDADHCGGCNQPCPSPASCVDGNCRCPEGYIDCDGVGCVFDDGDVSCCPDAPLGYCTNGNTCCGDICANTNVSTQHCGGCDQPCTEGNRCCDGDCVDIRTDVNHCSRCDAPCPAGHQCCGGYCSDPQFYECCRDHPQLGSQCPIATHFCCTRSDGLPGCCTR